MNTIEENLDDKTRAALKAFRESLCAAAKKAYYDSNVGLRGDFSPNRILHPNGARPSDVPDND